MQTTHSSSELSGDGVKARNPKVTKLSKEQSNQLRQWLIQVANQRDKQAFAGLFKFFAPKIVRFGINQLNSEAQAQELLQDTMTNIWRKAHLFDQDKGAATTWVYTVMRNMSFDMLRKQQTRREDYLSDEIWPLIEQTEDESMCFNDHLMDKKLISYLDQLPEQQKQVVKGIYFHELSHEQLAKQLDVPVGTVKSRLRLALTKLNKKMEAHHD